MNNIQREKVWLLDDNKEDKKPFTKFEMFLIKLTLYIGAIIIAIYIKSPNYKRRGEIKRKLRYFNPIIKKNFWGNEYIEWVGRDKPLTDEELNKLM